MIASRSRSRILFRGVLASALLLLVSTASAAADRYALVITGAAGATEYVLKYRGWRTSFVDLLRNRFNYPADHVVVLADDEDRSVRRSTRENVRAAFTDLARRT